MTRWLLSPLLLMVAVLMAGCIPNNVRQSEAAVFDFGVTASGWEAPALQRVDVVAPSWLGTTAMQYRLAYSEGARRRAYADSRWAAPPAELLEQALRRRAAGGAGSGQGQAVLPCRLRLELDELAQTFDSPQASRLVLAARARLLCRGEQVLAGRSFRIERPAGSDAAGGVAAAAAAVDELGRQIAAWVVAEKVGAGDTAGVAKR